MSEYSESELRSLEEKLSSGQSATARARIFVEEAKLPQKAVDAYIGERNIGSLRWRRLVRRTHPVEIAAKTALSELFSIPKDDENGLQKFRELYRDDADSYLNLQEQVEKEFGSFCTRIMSQAVNWGIRDRMLTALKVCKEAAGMDSTQKRRLLEIVGYTAEESKNVLSRAMISGFMYPAIWFLEDKVPDALGIAGGITMPLLNNDLGKIDTWVFAVGSAFMYYGTQWLKIEQTRKLLKDKRVKTIPNPTAVLSYHLFEKIFADRPNVAKWATRIGYVANPFEAAKELWWGVFPVNPSVFMTGNLAAISMNMIELGAIEGTRLVQIWRSYRQGVMEDQ